MMEDHHLDAGRHAHVVGADRYVVFDRATMAGVGSTCTLVAQRLLDDADESAEEAASPALGPRLAEMLLSTIALDTAGLDEAAGKTTVLDIAVVRRLRAVIDAGAQAAGAGATAPAPAPELEPRAIFARLMALKQEPAFWRALSVPQALGFDFKAFALPPAAAGGAGAGKSAGVGESESEGEFGTSSVMASLSDFLGGWAPEGAGRRAERLREVVAFARERGLEFAVVLCAVSGSGGGPMERGLALVAPAGSRGARLVDEAARLLPLRAPELLLEEEGAAASAEEASACVRVRSFRQGNGRASRKQVVPLLLAALAEAEA
jgi:hypothetical protein